MSSSATPVSRGSLPPSSFLGRFVVASIVAVVAVFFGRCYTIKIEVLQILGLSLVSIIAVGIVAGILIYITPDVINSKTDKKHGTFNRRGRTRHRSRDAIKKVPSLPPRPSHPRTTNSNYFNYNSTTGRVRSSNSRYRRYSSPPSLGRSLSQQSTLNPIAERRLEDLPDYDDYWWRELDSRTKYYALILGYTQPTWDEDHELYDLICEDWYWDEMTKEQKAAAQYFGYTKETWND